MNIQGINKEGAKLEAAVDLDNKGLGFYAVPEDIPMMALKACTQLGMTVHKDSWIEPINGEQVMCLSGIVHGFYAVITVQKIGEKVVDGLLAQKMRVNAPIYFKAN